MDILGKLFGGNDKVKILRLFFANQENSFSKEEISKKSKVIQRNADREIALFLNIGIIKKKKIKVFKVSSDVKKQNNKKVAVLVYQLNKGFIYFNGLRDIFLGSDILIGNDLLNRIKNTGKIKLVITAGIFMNNKESRADLLVVGEGIQRKSLDKIIDTLESEIGHEINYGVFDTEDFKYRLTVYDKFVRDILDFPHNRILDKLGELDQF